jgi:hypothetical protein
MTVKLAGLQEQLAALMGQPVAPAAPAPVPSKKPASRLAAHKGMLRSAVMLAAPPPAFEDEV